MTVRPLSIAFVVLLSTLDALAQQNQPPVTCPATEQAVREAEHQIWAAFHNRDLAALDKLIDDDAISTDDSGTSKGKRERLAAIKRPEGDIHTEPSEQPQDFRVVFTDGVAILNFTRHWTDYEKKMGIDWGAAVRVTMVFACKDGRWRDVAFQETDMPNKNRKPLVGASDHFDDYVGHYRFGESGDKGEVSITRVGDKLYDTWADEEATELLPGKYDMFFSGEDGSAERFVRDNSGKVTGILYTLGDGEFEAKRLDTGTHDTSAEGDEIRSMIGKYARSVDEADTALASQVWLDSPDVSFIDPLGHEHGFDQIKQNVYRRLMGDTFSERKLTPRDISVHVYGDSAWAEFYWDFAAKFKKDGSPLTTHGRETQVYRRTADGWRLVHVHYSAMPVAEKEKGF